jgi:hypothetical protein
MNIKKITLLIGIYLSIVLTTFAQQNNEIVQYAIKQDSSYFFIDNTRDNWYTFAIKTDTMFHIVKNIYYWGNDKTIQIGSVYFDSEKINPVSVFGFQKSNKYNLLALKNWELKYHNEQYHKKLKSGTEFYQNPKGKNFLIWWFKHPKGNWNDMEIEVPLNNTAQEINNTEIPYKTLESTHQLYLTFIIHGNTYVMICIPVWTTETLKNQIQRLKTMANSLNVYGGDVDFNTLAKRLKNEKIVVKDSLNFIEIEVPDWLNVTASPYDNYFIASFPEKDYIINAVGVGWKYNTDSLSFLNFIKKEDYSKKENLKILEDTDTVKRYFFTDNRDWFYSQDIYLKGTNIYCKINFTATKSTYDYNVERFYEFVKSIKLE